LTRSSTSMRSPGAPSTHRTKVSRSPPPFSRSVDRCTCPYL
jgi:hypothetical protein